MRIDPQICIGCMDCIAVCSVGAIVQNGNKCVVDQDQCVECYTCLRSRVCKEGAFEEVPLEWPRTIRHAFSSVTAAHGRTGIAGRGEAEMKTNDVTGRYRLGKVGFTVDVGRPGLGTAFDDVEMIAMAVARLGVEFEPMNPVTGLMADRTTGRFRDDIKKERVMSCILTFQTEDAKLLAVIDAIRDVSRRINTVFSVGCISRCNPDGTVPIEAVLRKAGVFYRPNGKTNIGIGRPLAKC